MSESAGGQLYIESRSDLKQIIHKLKNAVIFPEAKIIGQATQCAGSAELIILNHGLKSGDLVTVAGCAGGGFEALNGVRRLVVKIDDDAISINTAVSGAYTPASGTIVCTSLADYLFDTFDEAVLKIFMGINSDNPPAAANYPALFIRSQNWDEEQITADSAENKRGFILRCLISDETQLIVGPVTEFTGPYKAEKMARLVMDYIKRYFSPVDFGLEFSVENNDALYYPEFVVDINLTINYGNPL